eukprot:TRINITY_DN12413_c0_g2_i1.p1 TRINITY_DN12413_c0_g2~~TRINITY_DN12413_c0_g2_i1.p1  ORF type:complete len:475 (-),score=64.87 TRINITY_DN12413_c0_g2_i1:86-1510(-)
MLRGACMTLAAILAESKDTPGFQFLGYGYDALYGNPRSTTGNGDPGFRTNVFKFTQNDGQKTTDGKWDVPDKTTSQDFGTTCSATQTSRVLASAYDYQHTVDDGISVNAGFMGLEFSLSSDFKQIDNETRSNTSIFAQVSAQCAAYQLTMHTYDHPDVDMNFIDGVNTLPDQYVEAPYMLFLQSFGTHVVTQLQVGGRWGWQMTFDRFAYNNMLDNSIDVESGIEYAGKLRAGIKSQHIEDRKSAMAVAQAIAKNATFNVGGSFSPDMEAWMASVKDEPMPTHLTLLPLDQLLTSIYFPNVANATLLARAEAMRLAVKNYCSYIQKHSDPSVVCTPPKPLPAPKPDPVASNAVRRICVLNDGGYAMNWELNDLTTQYPVSASTGTYAHGQTDCLDGLLVGASRGDKINCRVNKIAGASLDCWGGDFSYDERAHKQANFACDGSTFTGSCHFTGLSGYAEAELAAEKIDDTHIFV